MNVDISKTVDKKTDQMNADDLLDGPMTGSVEWVRAGSQEQPVSIKLTCWPQPYKPCKTMRRVLCEVWGKNLEGEFVGRSMTLFRNPTVRYGSEEVGGIEISHVSHIEGPRVMSLPVSRGKKKKFTILPLVKQAAQQPASNPLRGVFETMKTRWKESVGDKATAESFGLFVSEATHGVVGMSEANQLSKYTAELIAQCEAAITN